MHDAQGSILLRLARQAIAARFGFAEATTPAADWLHEPGATFVTLTRQGALRGCIGSLQAHRPLHEDVQANARAAAFRDPRFAPLLAAELDITRVEVSLLSPAQALYFDNEDDALAQLQPGEDGLILEAGGYRSTFLPQVWEQLPTPAQFLAQLKRKAGLPGDFWSTEIRLSRYRVTKWQEPSR